MYPHAHLRSTRVDKFPCSATTSGSLSGSGSESGSGASGGSSNLRLLATRLMSHELLGQNGWA
eukprot:5751848-Pyramimonas_sp.AAC.1